MKKCNSRLRQGVLRTHNLEVRLGSRQKSKNAGEWGSQRLRRGQPAPRLCATSPYFTSLVQILQDSFPAWSPFFQVNNSSATVDVTDESLDIQGISSYWYQLGVPSCFQPAMCSW